MPSRLGGPPSGSGPASTSSTRRSGRCANRLARTAPAVPAPTTTSSQCSTVDSDTGSALARARGEEARHLGDRGVVEDHLQSLVGADVQPELVPQQAEHVDRVQGVAAELEEAVL